MVGPTTTYAYSIGYDAYFRYHMSRWENPYDRELPEFADWDDGWNEAWIDLNEK